MNIFKSSLICITISLVSLCNTNFLAAQYIRPNINDSLILVNLYNSTNGPNWNNHAINGWLTKAPLYTWADVSLDYSGRVTTLYLPFNNLYGNIPSSLGNLSELLELSLSGNNLMGYIPTSLGNLKRLQDLYLDQNQLSGSIPSELGDLTNTGVVRIFNIDLSNNQLDGVIPNNLAKLTNLSSLRLNNNLLSGNLPADFVNFSSLDFFDVSSNRLTGPIPLIISDEIHLENNRFTFEGLEALINANHYVVCSPQAKIPVIKNGVSFHVNAGGTMFNNTYNWYDETGSVTTVSGSSSFSAKPGHNYSCTVTNSVATQLTLYSQKIGFLNPYPTMITRTGLIETDISKINYNLNKFVKGAVTDGISKVLIVASSEFPVRFSLSDIDDGSLNSLSDQNSKNMNVTIQPINGTIVAIYNAPDGYGRSNPKGGRDIIITSNFNDGSGVEQLFFRLVTPPVVLVHGMWSNPTDTWVNTNFKTYLEDNDFSQKEIGFDNIKLVNYKNDNYRTFDPHSAESIPARDAVNSAIISAINDAALQGIVATQVDVVAHSLGALHTRSYSQNDDMFLQSRNYYKGYIHKLISIGAPHLGSQLGPILFQHKFDRFKNSLKNPSSLFLEPVMALIGNKLGSCHEDFEPNFKQPPHKGKGLDNINETKLFKVHAITGTWKPRGKDSYNIISKLTKIFANQELDEAIRDPENDVIVPEYSQLGGLDIVYGNSNYYDFFRNIIHAKIPLAYDVNNETADIFSVQGGVRDLLLSNDPKFFAKGFPAPRDVPTPFDAVSPLFSKNSSVFANNRVAYTFPNNDTSDYYLQVLNPLRGQQFNNDGKDSMDIELKFTDSLKLNNTLIFVQNVGWATTSAKSPFIVKIPIPSTLSSGHLLIAAIGNDFDGNLYADTLSVAIGSTGNLINLKTEPGQLVLDSNSRESSLQVSGQYVNSSDSIVRDLSSTTTGTTYTTNKSDSIISVDANGNVVAHRSGSDTIFIQNGGFIDTVLVTVKPDIFLSYKFPNIITFSVLDKTKAFPPFSLTAISSSGEEVKYQLVSGPVILQNGVITIQDTGTVSIIATSPSNAYFDIAPSVSATFQILPSDQIINTKALLETKYCSGTSLKVPYSASGTLNKTNNFFVQLSDTAGRFIHPQDIGAISSTQSDTITVTIPFNTLTGTRYRVRVISDNPLVAGSDNGSDISIYQTHTFYHDADGDGYGSPADTVVSCFKPIDYVLNNTDCTDNDPKQKGVQTTFYFDSDGDGFGDPSKTIRACMHLVGYVTNSTDCNDNNNAIHPCALEIPDGIDNDCNGLTDEPPFKKLWDKRLGGISNDALVSFQKTTDGGYMLAGNSSDYDGLGGDRKTPNKAYTDYWIIKADSSLNIEWEKNFGGNNSNNLTAALQTQDGGYILGGSSSSFGTVGAGDETQPPYADYYSDYWVVKLLPNGNIEWNYRFGGTDIDELTCLNQTPDGGYLLGGYSSSPVSVDPAHGNVTDPRFNDDPSAYLYNRDFWAVKIRANGTKEWDRRFGGSDNEQVSALQVLPDGSALLGGFSSSTAGVHKTGIKKGRFDYWVVKIDEKGNKQWDQTYGGNHINILNSIQPTSDGDFILGGYSDSPASYDKSEPCQDSPSPHLGVTKGDIWLVKIDKQGLKKWDKTIGGDEADYVSDIQETVDGYLLAGSSASSVNGDKTDSSHTPQVSDIWVIKIDTAGKKQWDQTIGGDGGDWAHDILPASGGGYLIGGTSFSNKSGDVSEENRGVNGDFWMVKLGVGCPQVYYEDYDKDGFGNQSKSIIADAQPVGYISDSTDCNDTSEFVHPGVIEICNGIDDNCDGNIDEVAPSSPQISTWIGNVSNDWNTAANWSCNVVPNAGADIIISANNTSQLFLTSDVSVGNIYLENVLHLNDKILTINGSIIGAGTITGSALSGIIINGNAGSLNFTPGAAILKTLTLKPGATARIDANLLITGP